MSKHTTGKTPMFQFITICNKLQKPYKGIYNIQQQYGPFKQKY